MTCSDEGLGAIETFVTALYFPIATRWFDKIIKVCECAPSSPIVGYMQDGIVPAKYNMISVPFNKVDGTGVTLDDFNIPGFAKNINEDYVDYLMIWKAAMSAYDAFYYYYDPDYPEDNDWYKSGTESTFDELYPSGLSAGQALWYLPTANVPRSSISCTMSGAVEDSDDTGWMNLEKAKYNMVANPYPVAWKINDDAAVQFTNFAKNINEDYVDYIMVWKAEMSAYDAFYYYYDPDYPEDNDWYKSGTESTFDELYPTGIPAGTPVWILGTANVVRDSFSVKFFNPISK